MEKTLEQDYDVVAFVIRVDYWQIPVILISLSATCTETYGSYCRYKREQVVKEAGNFYNSVIFSNGSLH